MPFVGLKTTHPWIKFLTKAKKTFFEGMFVLFTQIRICLKNLASLVFDFSDPLTSRKISEKLYELFLRKTITDLLTY